MSCTIVESNLVFLQLDLLGPIEELYLIQTFNLNTVRVQVSLQEPIFFFYFFQTKTVLKTFLFLVQYILPSYL